MRDHLHDSEPFHIGIMEEWCSGILVYWCIGEILGIGEALHRVGVLEYIHCCGHLIISKLGALFCLEV